MKKSKTEHDLILIAFDAFRLALGIEPEHFTAQQILEWFKLMASEPPQ